MVDSWKGKGSLLDYFNPAAVSWWHALMDKTLAYDIDGWKCDGLDFVAWAAPWSPGKLAPRQARPAYCGGRYRRRSSVAPP